MTHIVLLRQIPVVAFLMFITTAASSAPARTELSQQAADILDKRCVVCHGCYDAPCQLKLEAREGLERGASKDKVYDGGRLVTAQMTRLFDDGFTERQWRKKGFFSVLDRDVPEAGLMHKMLALKQTHPLPSTGPLPEEFDFSLNRKQSCSKQSEFDDYANAFPFGGMPYGLPGLPNHEQQILLKWLETGAPAVALTPLSRPVKERLDKWESFLNGDSKKEQLMSRYVYEHLFLAGLYLVEEDVPIWFRLVRSQTPPGQSIDIIATRRPYDSPGSAKFYYRLQRMPKTILDKRHMPYRFDEGRMTWYRELFLDKSYEVTQLPDWSVAIASNPFKAFRDIPVKSRYRFLLEEAQFSIMNFIKGPVCRGQIALSVIDDHFWVVFVDPDSRQPELDSDFLATESDNLRLPTARTGTPIDLLAWRRYSKAQKRYSQAQAEYLQAELDEEQRNLDMDDLWDGDGSNENASLTIFRHFDTASVVKGMVGNTPKTAWVLNYPLMERIHYLLVAGFDVYGGVSHQLESRLYMDFLRMEGENNFLLFLPPEKRTELRNYWYRDARRSSLEHVFQSSKVYRRPTDIDYKTDQPKQELLQRLQERIHGAKAEPYTYRDANLARLENHIGQHNSFMPEVSFINIFDAETDLAYTILRNSGYSNIAQLFLDDLRRLPAEDSLTVAKGFIGAYPNTFLQVNTRQLSQFVDDVIALKSTGDYQRLLDNYGVHRNSPWFWRASDKFQTMYQSTTPENVGLFDYNRYQSR